MYVKDLLCKHGHIHWYVCMFVSPCVGGSKVPPRTLYRIKCVLAEILYGCQKQNGGLYVAREKLLREACKHTDKSRHRRHRPTGEGASRRPYEEAHAQIVPTALPAFQGSLLLAFDPTASGKRPAIVYCSHGVSEEHRKRQKGSGELDGSAHAVSPAHNCILR